jgi:glycerophosphoryl diester phosphodiesterase
MKLKRSFLYTLALTLVATSLGLNIATATPAQAAALSSCSYAQTVSHRGYADRGHTENTLRAFYNAEARGSRTLETDVRVTRYGQWVIMHDSTINRTTRSKGSVASLTLKRINNIRTNDGVRGGIPTLQKVLAHLRNSPSVKMHLEIKSLNPSDAALRRLIYNVATVYNVEDRVVITSFGSTVLRRVKAIAPGLETGLISSSAVAPRTAKAYGNTVSIDYRRVSPALVANMHKAGVKVYAWTVDSRAGWGRMVSAGVDGITTDYTPTINSYCRAARG